MVSRKQDIEITLLQLVDALLVAMAIPLAWHVRAAPWVQQLAFDFAALRLPELPPFSEFYWLFYLLMPVLPLMLENFGLYARRRLPWQRVWKSLLLAHAAVLLLLGLLSLVFKVHPDSRIVVLLALLFSMLAIYLRTLLQGQVRKRFPQRYEQGVLLAGHPRDMEAFERDVDLSEYQIFVLARYNLIDGDLEEFIYYIHEHSIARVLFCAEHLHFLQVEKALEVCELEGVEAWLSTKFLRSSRVTPHFEEISSHPMLVFRNAPPEGWALLLKSLLDRSAALLLLLLSAPLCLYIIWRIRRDDPGPAIFRQKRGGKHGKPFTMYKFRSMYLDAERRREELLAGNTMTGPVFKVDDDPRVTRFGQMIRRTSLDELPQLFNVLRGEMSLVGPRPLPVYEVRQIHQSSQRRRLSVKPGLTCLWQISGRNEITDFDDWCALDLEYIDNWSLWLDLSILFKTIPVVFARKGAK